MVTDTYFGHCWNSEDIANSSVAWRHHLLRWPGIEPGSTAWKAAMLATIPPTHALLLSKVCRCSMRDKVMKESVWQLFIIFLDTHQFPNLHEPWPVNFCPLLVLLGHMIDTLKWWVTLLHWPGIEPGSTAWEAAMLSTIPPMHVKTV